MFITDDLDCDALIARRAGPDRAAFRRASEEALSRLPCWTECAVYRAVVDLQRTFFSM
jgi:hypothetical protein